MVNDNSFSLIKGSLAAFQLFLLTAGIAWAENPVPLINQPLLPDAAEPARPGFTLTVNGAGFVSGSVVHWNGAASTTALAWLGARLVRYSLPV